MTSKSNPLPVGHRQVPLNIRISEAIRLSPPLPNYTLSTVCPACNTPTVRRACKVRCERCGFVWDCSEL